MDSVSAEADAMTVYNMVNELRSHEVKQKFWLVASNLDKGNYRQARRLLFGNNPQANAGLGATISNGARDGLIAELFQEYQEENRYYLFRARIDFLNLVEAYDGLIVDVTNGKQ